MAPLDALAILGTTLSDMWPRKAAARQHHNLILYIYLLLRMSNSPSLRLRGGHRPTIAGLLIGSGSEVAVPVLLWASIVYIREGHACARASSSPI